MLDEIGGLDCTDLAEGQPKPPEDWLPRVPTGSPGHSTTTVVPVRTPGSRGAEWVGLKQEGACTPNLT